MIDDAFAEVVVWRLPKPVVDRDERGRVEFPFDAVKVEFLLQAA